MSKIPEIPFDRVLGGIGEGYAYACHERGGSKEDHYFISESEAREILADREKLEKAREAACKIESLRNVHGIELRNQVDAPWEELGNALDLLREVIK